jgi:hypothetical protein
MRSSSGAMRSRSGQPRCRHAVGWHRPMSCLGFGAMGLHLSRGKFSERTAALLRS